jgi:SSS family transporter
MFRGESALHVVDIIVIVAYFLTMMALGIWGGRRQTSSEDFLLAGHGAGRWPIVISTFACLFSGISFLGTAGWLKSTALVPLTANMVSIFVVAVLVNAFLMPHFYNLRITSIYDFLETRYNRRVRLIVSFLFQANKALWIGGLLYIPALMFETLTGIPSLWWIICMTALGLFICFCGGLRSIMLTDLIQFTIMIVAMASIFFIGLRAAGWDIPAAWDSGRQLGITKAVAWGISPFSTTTFFFLIYMILINTAGYGSDQVGLQRYLSAKSLKEARKSVYLTPMVTFFAVVLLYAASFLVIVYFQTEGDPGSTELRGDQYIAQFVKVAMPVGLSGLIIAAVLSATISSFAGGVLSLTTATMEDFLRRLYPEGSDARYLRHCRYVTVAWCLVAFALTFLAARFESIVRYVLDLGGPLHGVILAVFLLGIYSKSSTSAGALFGAIMGVTLGNVLRVVRFTIGGEQKTLHFTLLTVIAFLAVIFFACVGDYVARRIVRGRETS